MNILSMVTTTLVMIVAAGVPQLVISNVSANTDKTVEFGKTTDKNVTEETPNSYEAPKTIENNLTEVVKTDRDKTLDKWKIKQAALWNNLPKGKFTINASAYTAAADECGKSDGITASGLKVEEKRTLACPPQYPFGAKLNIEGYGVYTCEDRGGAIKGNKFDIYVETKSEAFAFGRRNLVAEFVQ